MGLIVAHINKQLTAREADIRSLAAELKAKWETKAHADAQKLLSKIKPGEILVSMTSKPGA